MFIKNEAVSGFAFALISKNDGSAVTSGNVIGYVTQDGGSQEVLTSEAVHVGNGQWIIDLTAEELNGDMIGLLFIEDTSYVVSLNIKTEIPITSASVVTELLNTDIHAYMDPMTIGDTLHRIRYFARHIYVDTDAVTNGDGSDGFPFNNVNDAKDKAEAKGITAIYVAGDIVIPSNLRNMTIHGIGLPRIDLNGQDVRNTKFYNCSLSGVYLSPIIATECYLESGLLLRGHFMDCELDGSYTAASESRVMLYKCTSGIPGTGYSTISMNSSLPTQISVRSFNGGLHIVGMDHIDDVITVEIAQGKLVFEASCLEGTMVARGGCVFNNLVPIDGATVIDETYFRDMNVVSFENDDVIANPVWNKVLP